MQNTGESTEWRQEEQTNRGINMIFIDVRFWFFFFCNRRGLTEDAGMYETVFHKKWQQYAYHTLLHA